MFVRLARFEDIDPEGRDARMSQFRRDIEAVKAGDVPEGMPPRAAEVLRSSVARVVALVDRDAAANEASAVFCPTEEDLRRVDEVLNAMSPGDEGGSRTGVAYYEVALDIEL